tara:strand:- start:898 stop:1428 length:531 start_codon:yes stop_codon:yes gene_type:complete
MAGSTSSYFDPSYSGAGFGMDIPYEVPKESYPAWKPGKTPSYDFTSEKKENNSFIDTHLRKAFEDQIGSYRTRFAGEKDLGDTYIKSGGSTTADLGGGNTLYAPDNNLALQTQLRFAQVGQQNQGGLGGPLGSIVGQAGGTALASSMGAGAGTFLGAAAGPLGAVLGGTLGSMLPF